MNAAIGMMDQSGCRLLTLDSYGRRFLRNLGMQRLPHRPADDLAGVHVEDRGKIEPPSPVGMYVRSASQIWFGAGATKLRPSLFGAIG